MSMGHSIECSLCYKFHAQKKLENCVENPETKFYTSYMESPLLNTVICHKLSCCWYYVIKCDVSRRGTAHIQAWAKFQGAGWPKYMPGRGSRLAPQWGRGQQRQTPIKVTSCQKDVKHLKASLYKKWKIWGFYGRKIEKFGYLLKKKIQKQIFIKESVLP